MDQKIIIIQGYFHTMKVWLYVWDLNLVSLWKLMHWTQGCKRPHQVSSGSFFLPIHKISHALCGTRPLLGHKHRAQQSLLGSSWTWVFWDCTPGAKYKQNNSKLIFYYAREVKPPALNMRLTDQPSNSAFCHGAERSLWCWAVPAEKAGEGATAQGKASKQVQLPQLLLCHVTQHLDPSFSHKSQSNAPAGNRNEALSKILCQCQRLVMPKGESKEAFTSF